MNEFLTASGGKAVTPSNTVNYGKEARALYVGQAGNVSLEGADGQTVLFEDVPVGTVLAIRHTRVNETGTTAQKMVTLW